MAESNWMPASHEDIVALKKVAKPTEAPAEGGGQWMPASPEDIRGLQIPITKDIQDLGNSVLKGREALDQPPPKEKVDQKVEELRKANITPNTGRPGAAHADYDIYSGQVVPGTPQRAHPLVKLGTDVAVSLAPGGAVARGLLGGANSYAMGGTPQEIITDAAINAVPGLGIAGGKAVLREASGFFSPAIMNAAKKTIGPEALGTLMDKMPEIIKHIGTWISFEGHPAATIAGALLGSIVRMGPAGKAFAEQLVKPGAGQGTARALSLAGQLVKGQLGPDTTGHRGEEQNGNNPIQ